MGLDYHFHLQHFNGDIWTTPPEFDDPSDRVMHGELTWFDDKDVTVLRLFLRDDALFPLNRNEPPEFVITELYRMSNRTPEMTDADVLAHICHCFAEHYVGWIGFDDLCLDLWNDIELLVQKSVPIGIADAFGDGSQPFPRQSLINAGWTDDEIDPIQDTSHYAYDEEYSANGHSLVDVPMNRTFPNPSGGGLAVVTWTVTIAVFIGDWRMEPIHKARQLASDDHLRLICTLS